MVIQRILAAHVLPGDRVLYVGTRRGRFLARVPHARPNSRTASTLPAADRGPFDVIMIVDAASLLPDDEAAAWAYRSIELLADRGRLIVATRPCAFDSFGFGADLYALSSALDPLRLIDPRSVFASFEREGFRQTGDLSGWASSYDVRVFEPIRSRGTRLPGIEHPRAATPTRA